MLVLNQVPSSIRGTCLKCLSGVAVKHYITILNFDFIPKRKNVWRDILAGQIHNQNRNV